MTQKQNWNTNWKFTKAAIHVAEPQSEEQIPEGSPLEGKAKLWQDVTLPHTWNGEDGQDGGNDYDRRTCYYWKTLDVKDLPESEAVYLELEGVNSTGDVYVNGQHLAHHDGGYSTWRVNLTDALQEHNDIVIAVDNAPNDHVYPQMADFTFYGGIYRDVSLLFVGKARFNLDDYGSPAVKVTPHLEEGKEDAEVEVEVSLTGVSGEETLTYRILDGEKKAVATTEAKAANPHVTLHISPVHRWHGRKDPYLYTLEISLSSGSQVLDERTLRFGCRTFSIDPEKGFFLNGESYPLRGVSRHQDRPHKGNAISRADHEEDMDLICEMGANTIRLAHYQHDQYFYDLCDERGMVVWAEIPYISKHLEKGEANTLSQMTELILQNYNHPSIVVWGLSNEITMHGTSTPELMENHRKLNDLCHELDATRLTTVAVISMSSMDEEYLNIPDVLSYNHYFGWYGGDTSMNGEFFDRFHKNYPNKAVGMSEYGCEALNWHTSQPQQGDYTEEYQAYYHEELIKQLFTRPFIWATHVWNMFDFGADARAEGGEDGMNHKGLVTFDRKYKKDAFYAYKAWLTDPETQPFVHLCGKRYVDRVEPVTKVTVYSNLPEVELLVNGKHLETKQADDHFFYFEVPNEGETTLTAKAGDSTDESHIRRVEVFNEDYRMKETSDVINWFDITTPEGYYSILDKMEDIMSTTEGLLFVKTLGQQMARRRKSSDGQEEQTTDMFADEGMMRMVRSFTVKRLLNMAGTMGMKPFNKEEILEINHKLNQIRKK